jgi:hypothetical protein
LRGAEPPRLWPFEGGFQALLAEGRVVVAETYPAEALRQLGLVPSGSKRRIIDRVAYIPALRLALSRLDAVLESPASAMLEAGFGPDFVPSDPWIRDWEGWVLGQTALPR